MFYLALEVVLDMLHLLLESFDMLYLVLEGENTRHIQFCSSFAASEEKYTMTIQENLKVFVKK